jgi:hypothetical protein
VNFDLQDFRAVELTRPRIKVLVGEFGSGKTELAVTLASYLQQAGLKAAVVDMDLVKPYFRTREHKQRLEAEGVTVVAAQEKLAQADLPIMPSDLSRVLFNPEYHVVIDAGGSKAAIVLGQIRNRILENGCEVLMVVNICRPFSADVNDIVAAIGNIGAAAGLAVTGLVSNTNLGAETTEQQVLAGLAVTREVSRITGLPVRWLVLPAWLVGTLTVDEPMLPLQPMTRYPWEENES